MPQFNSIFENPLLSLSRRVIQAQIDPSQIPHPTFLLLVVQQAEDDFRLSFFGPWNHHFFLFRIFYFLSTKKENEKKIILLAMNPLIAAFVFDFLLYICLLLSAAHAACAWRAFSRMLTNMKKKGKGTRNFFSSDSNSRLCCHLLGVFLLLFYCSICRSERS